MVTFKNAGSTVVRCVSYDGGIYSECRVSTEGDRTALKAAIEKYKNTDYTQYEYEYGMAFKNAYEHAMVVLNDKSMSQENIDAAASALESAGEALATHPYVSVSTINVKYETQSRNLLDNATSVGGGTVGSNGAVSIDLSKKYSNYNNYNDIFLTASCEPEGAMYKFVNWEVIENQI